MEEYIAKLKRINLTNASPRNIDEVVYQINELKQALEVLIETLIQEKLND